MRYFISIAGPETSDSDFTWSEFVRRNNSELVAAWGNLVNRTGAMIAKNFGEIPTPGESEQIDTDLLDAVRGGFDTVGGLIGAHQQRAALTEIMRLVGEANTYVTRTEPFKLKAPEQRERLATVLNTLVQAVSDLNTMMSVFCLIRLTQSIRFLAARVISLRCRTWLRSLISIPITRTRSSRAITARFAHGSLVT